MQRPRFFPLKGSVHRRENGLHKDPIFQTKEMSKEIPASATTPTNGPSPSQYMPPPPCPFRPFPYIYKSSASVPLPALLQQTNLQRRKSTQVKLREKMSLPNQPCKFPSCPFLS